MMTLNVLAAVLVIIILVLAWRVVTSKPQQPVTVEFDEPESPHTEDFASVHEDTPEVLAGSEMPNEMVEEIVEPKPKRGRPKKNG